PRRCGRYPSRKGGRRSTGNVPQEEPGRACVAHFRLAGHQPREPPGHLSAEAVRDWRREPCHRKAVEQTIEPGARWMCKVWPWARSPQRSCSPTSTASQVASLTGSHSKSRSAASSPPRSVAVFSPKLTGLLLDVSAVTC